MPKIQHTILKWARETSGLTIEEAARKLQFKDSKSSTAAEKLAAYESGVKDPSRPLLLKMSNKYHRPLLTFYLNGPPIIGDRGEDFRTLPEDIDLMSLANVDVLVRDIKARQSAIRNSLIDADEANELSFVGKHSLGSTVSEIVNTIKSAIDFDYASFRRCPTTREAFRYLRKKLEGAGVFVILKGNLGSYHSDISVKVFRGFALSDGIAPFIVVNDRDADSTWSFTLIHEMAHIALGKTGISGEINKLSVEKFCNDVASEFILPWSEFAGFKLETKDPEKIRQAISRYAALKNVSNTHIAYRLYKRDEISKKEWGELRDFYREKWLENKERLRQKNEGKDIKINQNVIKRFKLGELVQVVQRLKYSGILTTSQAAMVLGEKPLKVDNLFRVG